MTGRAVLGHIDCPSCKSVGTMRITHDKNGDPFGFCEADLEALGVCAQQLRVGGNKGRVKKFIEGHPWAAAPGTGQAAPAAPVTATPAPEKPVPVTAKKPAPAPVTVTAPAKKAGPFDFLASMGAKA